MSFYLFGFTSLLFEIIGNQFLLQKLAMTFLMKDLNLVCESEFSLCIACLLSSSDFLTQYFKLSLRRFLYERRKLVFFHLR